MKVKIVLTLLLIIYSVSFSFCKEIKYKVSDIPEELLDGSKAVIRENDVVLTVTSESHAEMEWTYAITILKEEAFELAEFLEYYDKFIKIDFHSGLIYNEAGEQINKVKKEDILDYSAVSGFSLYEDTRIKYIKPEVRQYPFTIEYKYKISYSSLLLLPILYLQYDYYLASECATFTLIDPDNNMRYYKRNLPDNMETKKDDELHTISWEFKNIKPVLPELYSRSEYDILPCIHFAPLNFKTQNYEGKMDNWKDFGLWFTKLNAKRNEISEETILNVKELTKMSDDSYEKTKIVFEYLQSKTRYVNIKIGIGGLQPLKASLVDKYSYGDCKALTNYMKSMLDAIGIESFYTIIRAGPEAQQLIQEFSQLQFNHAILCVSLDNDTIWLECTNQNIPFGYIGDFTDDRYALLITDEGGVLKKTKTYPADENKKITTTCLTLDESGNADVDIQRTYIGLKYDEIMPVLYTDQENKKRYIEKRIEFPKFDLIDFSHEEIKDRIPVVHEKVQLISRNYTSRIGDRYMVLCNPVNRIEYVPRQRSQRKNTVYIRRSEIEIDTVIFSYPPSLEVEALPDPADISSRFGNYSSTIMEKDGKVILVRKIEFIKGEHPPETFGELVEFREQIVAADRNKFVLKKKM